MALQLHRSNRTERLVDALAQAVARPPASPFQPEWVAVSSPGMERWLSMELARRLGVWAHPAFPFPRHLIDSVLRAVLPPLEREGLYDPTCMLFGIARLLKERAADATFAPAERYCSGPESERRRLLLAERLAELFDQYLTFRPELALDWQASGAAAGEFQAALFAALAQRHGPDHIAARARAALARLRAAGPSVGLPERLHVFGVSTLPPLYVDVLAALAEQREVNLYLLSPTREYFGDVRSPRERRARSSRRQLSFADEGFKAEPHPLLGSFGRHAREFHELLEERTQYREAADELYEDPGSDSLLHSLQSDLLALRAPAGPGSPRRLLASDDRSLSIHACHGPMRELEVLHDQLTRWVSQGIEPHEIVVMAPDIAEYAPVIDAVFSQSEADRPALPFRIADRGAAETQPLLVALEAVLDVLQSRFGANPVLDLLAIDLVRARFGIAPDQVEILRGWVEQSGIRWGVDAAHRAEVGQPAASENTWRFGLARLALGYSTGNPPEQLFAEHAPAEIDGADAALLGGLLEFCSRLFAFRIELAAPGTTAEWRERFERLLGGLFAGELTAAAEQKLVRRAFSELEAHAARAGFDDAFDLTSLRGLLRRMLAPRLPAHGFLAGGITFCQLMPMRSIPFKVLCLIGLNDGVFPASDNAFAFDMMRAQRRAGDRSRRDDDRQLFLEALLCAREALIISYLGQSHKDGKPLPPSVLVSELIDHVAQSFALPDAGEMEQRLVVRHALSAASPRYFGADADPRLFSFSQAACRAALAFQRPRRRPLTFARIRSPAPAPAAEIALADLERCLMRPSREFCQQRLALYLGHDLARLEEREPFQLDALERWQIATDLLERRRRGDGAGAGLAVQRALGRLPLAAAGARVHGTLEREVAAILRRHAGSADSTPLPPLELDLRLGGLSLTGRLDGLWSGAQVAAQYGRLASRHELRAFIRHVVLGCVARERPELGLPETSVLIGRNGKGVGVVRFEPLDDPFALLRDLLEVQAAALRAPLPLFAAASWRYVEVLRKEGRGPQPLSAARDAFTSGAFKRVQADDQDPYVQQLYPDFDAMLELEPGAFERAAERVYGPLFQGRTAA